MFGHLIGKRKGIRNNVHDKSVVVKEYRCVSIETSKCLSNLCSQITSLATKDKTRYFDSTEYLDIVVCFTYFQAIKESLRKNTKNSG